MNLTYPENKKESKALQQGASHLGPNFVLYFVKLFWYTRKNLQVSFTARPFSLCFQLQFP